MGDHLKVIAGHYESDTGLIVRIENNIAIIFSDLTLHEVCVCARLYYLALKYNVLCRRHFMYAYNALNLLSFCS